eukprot:gene27709-23296_t
MAAPPAAARDGGARGAAAGGGGGGGGGGGDDDGGFNAWGPETEERVGTACVGVMSTMRLSDAVPKDLQSKGGWRFLPTCAEVDAFRKAAGESGGFLWPAARERSAVLKATAGACGDSETACLGEVSPGVFCGALKDAQVTNRLATFLAAYAARCGGDTRAVTGATTRALYATGDAAFSRDATAVRRLDRGAAESPSRDVDDMIRGVLRVVYGTDQLAQAAAVPGVGAGTEVGCEYISCNPADPRGVTEVAGVRSPFAGAGRWQLVLPLAGQVSAGERKIPLGGYVEGTPAAVLPTVRVTGRGGVVVMTVVTTAELDATDASSTAQRAAQDVDARLTLRVLYLEAAPGLLVVRAADGGGEAAERDRHRRRSSRRSTSESSAWGPREREEARLTSEGATWRTDAYQLKRRFGDLRRPRRPLALLGEVVADYASALQTEAGRERWRQDWRAYGKHVWEGFEGLPTGDLDDLNFDTREASSDEIRALPASQRRAMLLGICRLAGIVRGDRDAFKRARWNARFATTIIDEH